MTRAQLAWDGDVAVVTMQDGENRLHPEMVEQLDAALDEVEGKQGPAAVVLTGQGKFFSNGLDLDHMAAEPDRAVEVLDSVHRLLARLLAFPGAVVAGVNGHAFAAGAMLVMTCDASVMRQDRGYFCLPEVDLGIPFTPGMNALLASRFRPDTAHTAMVLGHRFSGEQALAGGIVSAVAADDLVVAEAVERAGALAGKPRLVLGILKSNLYGDALRLLRTPTTTGWGQL